MVVDDDASPHGLETGDRNVLMKSLLVSVVVLQVTVVAVVVVVKWVGVTIMGVAQLTDVDSHVVGVEHEKSPRNMVSECISETDGDAPLTSVGGEVWAAVEGCEVRVVVCSRDGIDRLEVTVIPIPDVVEIVDWPDTVSLLTGVNLTGVEAGIDSGTCGSSAVEKDGVSLLTGVNLTGVETGIDSGTCGS